MAGCSAPLTLTSATPSTCDEPLRDDGVGGVVERARRHGLRRQREDHDRRRRRIGLAEGRPRLQVARQVGLRRVERRLHVARRAVDAAVQVELHRDAGRAERAARGQFGHAGNFAEPAFERRRDRRRHGLRIGARPARVDADGRELDRRHAGDRQEAVGHRADEQQADGEQRRADRPADERLRRSSAPPCRYSAARWLGVRPSCRSSSVCSGSCRVKRDLSRSIAR